MTDGVSNDTSWRDVLGLLQKLRIESSITEETVAETMEMDVAHIKSLEMQRCEPSLSVLQQYARALGYSLTPKVEQPIKPDPTIIA